MHISYREAASIYMKRRFDYDYSLQFANASLLTLTQTDFDPHDPIDPLIGFFVFRPRLRPLSKVKIFRINPGLASLYISW